MIGLLVIIALASVLVLRDRRYRRQFRVGGLSLLPILLIEPLTRVGYFENLSTSQLIVYFLVRGSIAFMIGGLVVVAYEAIIAQRLNKKTARSRHHLQVYVIGFLVSLLLFWASVLPFASALTVSLLFTVVIIFLWRSDLLWDALFSGLAAGLLYAALYAVLFRVSGMSVSSWYSAQLSGVTLVGIPVEQLMVAAVFGAFFGPLYIAGKSYHHD